MKTITVTNQYKEMMEISYRMDKIMGAKGKLGGVEDQLIKDLKRTTTTFRMLGKRYGVSCQAIFYFCQKKRIKRPKKEITETCPICQGLLQIARQEHSDFISSHTIKKQLKIKPQIFRYHIGILRKKGLISNRFGKLRSTRLEQAYKIYFRERLPVRTIGRKVGINNFGSILRVHKTLGWEVPPPLFIFDPKAKRANLVKMSKRKKKYGTPK